MKKIIVCLALSVLCFFGGAASFLANDVTAYAGWAHRNYPRMADKLDRRMERLIPGWRCGDPAPGHERRHHEAQPGPPPRRNEARPAPAPAPAPEAPAAPSPQS